MIMYTSAYSETGVCIVFQNKYLVMSVLKIFDRA